MASGLLIVNRAVEYARFAETGARCSKVAIAYCETAEK
jgi:hypothetical protein